MRLNRIQLMLLAGMVGGCAHGGKPFLALGPATGSSPTTTAEAASPASAPDVVETPAAPTPAPEPVTSTVAASPTTRPVVTSALGTVSSVPGLAPKPKPFIALPHWFQIPPARPSTLLMEHESLDSPIPLSEYAKQPVHKVADFHLQAGLSAEAVTRAMGLPAAIADNGDPWLVYRLPFDQEIWLHFGAPMQSHLDAADVIRGAEDGYIRTRVFSADDSK